MNATIVVECEGKRYEIVDYRVPLKDEFFLARSSGNQVFSFNGAFLSWDSDERHILRPLPATFAADEPGKGRRVLSPQFSCHCEYCKQRGYRGKGDERTGAKDRRVDWTARTLHNRCVLGFESVVVGLRAQHQLGKSLADRIEIGQRGKAQGRREKGEQQ